MAERKLYYIAIKDGKRTGMLSGPYDSESESISNSTMVRGMARQADHWADFYSFCIAAVDAATPPFKTVFGKVGA